MSFEANKENATITSIIIFTGALLTGLNLYVISKFAGADHCSYNRLPIQLFIWLLSLKRESFGHRRQNVLIPDQC